MPPSLPSSPDVLLPPQSQNPHPLRSVSTTNRRSSSNPEPTAPSASSRASSSAETMRAELYEELFARAEEEILRLRLVIQPGDGLWGRKGDRTGIRDQVANQGTKDGRRTHRAWEWISSDSLSSGVPLLIPDVIAQRDPIHLPHDIIHLICKEAASETEILRNLCLTSTDTRQSASPLLYKIMHLHRAETLASFFSPPPSSRFRSLKRSLTLDHIQTLHFYCPDASQTLSYPFADLPRLKELHIRTVYPHRTFKDITRIASTFLSGLSPFRLILRDDAPYKRPEDEWDREFILQGHFINSEDLYPLVKVWWELRQIIFFDSLFVLAPWGDIGDSPINEDKRDTFFDPPFHPDIQIVHDLGDWMWRVDKPRTWKFWKRMDTATHFYERPNFRPGSFVVLSDKHGLLQGLAKCVRSRVVIVDSKGAKDRWYQDRGIDQPQPA